VAGSGHVESPYDTALNTGRWGWGQRNRILGRIVLNGGNIDRMTLRAFIFAAQGLMAEEGLSFHVETVAPEPTAADTKERNAQSMSVLQGMLGGVQGAPKGARR
jgi:hypothetical protein